MLPLPIFSHARAAIAGFVISTFFMVALALVRWGGVLSWVGLHAVGGAIGGIVGASFGYSPYRKRLAIGRDKGVDGDVRAPLQVFVILILLYLLTLVNIVAVQPVNP